MLARPLKDGMAYFTHDTDATNDEKIEAMRAAHGNDGYAFYFILLERIYRSENGAIDISSPLKKSSAIEKIKVSKKKFEILLNDALELNLFDRCQYEKSGILTSDGIHKRFLEVTRQREKWRNTKVIQKENGVENSKDNGGKRGEKEREMENTPVVPQNGDGDVKNPVDERFSAFWKAYPKKVGKGAAEKSFNKIKPSAELLSTILSAIEKQKQSEQWQKDGGQYIPGAQRWLNEKRWEDEPGEKIQNSTGWGYEGMDKL